MIKKRNNIDRSLRAHLTSQEQNTEIENVNKKPKLKQPGRGSDPQIRERIVRSSAARFGAVEFAEDVEGGDEADEAEAHHQHHRR